MENIPSAVHSITDGRLTLKKPHVDFLKNPPHVIVTFGPGNRVLLHNPTEYDQLIERLFGGTTGMLDADQYFVAQRLENVAEIAAIDDQSRMRLSQIFLDRMEIKEKSAKIYAVTAKRDGWLELHGASFNDSFDDAKDPWLRALSRLVTASRAKQTG